MRKLNNIEITAVAGGDMIRWCEVTHKSNPEKVLADLRMMVGTLEKDKEAIYNAFKTLIGGPEKNMGNYIISCHKYEQ